MAVAGFKQGLLTSALYCKQVVEVMVAGGSILAAQVQAVQQAAERLMKQADKAGIIIRAYRPQATQITLALVVLLTGTMAIRVRLLVLRKTTLVYLVQVVKVAIRILGLTVAEVGMSG